MPPAALGGAGPTEWDHVAGGKKDCTTTNRATPAGWPAKPWFPLLEVALADAARKPDHD